MTRIVRLATVLIVLVTECLLAIAAGPLHSPLFAVEVDLRPGKAIYLTMLRPEIVSASGVPPEAIVGQIFDGAKDVAPQNFARNRIFVEYLHAFIEREGRRDSSLKAEAKKIGSGRVIVADQRGSTPALSEEDFFGEFDVSAGILGRYKRNESHRILSERGLFRLPDSLESLLITDLERKAKAAK